MSSLVQMTAQQLQGSENEQSQSRGSDVAQPHDFEVQKQIHQQIRNDPDYDDWDYGTEPLPHEAWVQGQGQSQGSESDRDDSKR